MIIQKQNFFSRKSVRISIKILLVMILVAAGFFKAHSQVGQTMYFMNSLPQSAILNPALQHNHALHIGLPGISSLNVNARTNFANFNDLIFKHPQYDSLISFLHPDANLNDFISILQEKNTVASDLNVNLFTLGFRVKRSYLSFSVAERSFVRANLPGDFLKLGLLGNEQFVGKTAEFSTFGVDMNYFREYAAGYSLMVDDKLSIGFRAKILFGKASLSFADTEFNLFTDPDTYSMRLRSRFTMNVSMPVTVTLNEDGFFEDVVPHFDDANYDPLDFILNSKNAGFAIDLGATYKIADRMTLYASATDIGFIGWSQDVYNFSVDGTYEFDGVDFSPFFIYDDDSDPGENLLDSLKGVFKINDSGNSFNKGLPARVYLGGTYNLSPGFSLGLLSRSEIYQRGFEQAVTLSANSNLGRWLSASVSYSAMNNSYNNFGAGLMLRAAGFQLYVMSDNLNAVFSPQRANSANVWFGLNFVFGRRQPKTKDVQEVQYEVPPPPPVVEEPEEPEEIEEPEELESEEPEEPEYVIIEDAEDPASYYIVAGSFQEYGLAVSYADSLKEQGFQADIIDSDIGMYRVHIFIYGDREEAVRMLELLRALDESPPVWLLTQ